MRCLFVTSKSPDLISACLYDGLQEVLGEENVVDAVGSPWLHRSSLIRLHEDGNPHQEFYPICGSREGNTLWKRAAGNFDLLVLNACFNRDCSWDDLCEGNLGFLKKDARIAYVEGWDAAWHVEPPRVRVDAVFRREISPAVQYPYEPHHLSFAMPSRLFVEGDHERPYDCFFAGNPRSCHPERPVRWPMLSRAFQTQAMHHSLLCSGGLGGWAPYWEAMTKSKLALVPPGADDCEPLRLYEAAAAGAIPILLCFPAYRRSPWFRPEACFDCGLDGLPGCIESALASDLAPRRKALLEDAKKNHTTRARAERLLEVVL